MSSRSSRHTSLASRTCQLLVAEPEPQAYEQEERGDDEAYD
jgi:hypothetical protein